jgi:hypothetical protein
MTALLSILGYFVFSFVLAVLVARHWHRLPEIERAGHSPKSVFLMTMFFAPLVLLAIVLDVLANATVWIIENSGVIDLINAIIVWRNK